MANKILIICPKFHPLKDGLSGHTTKLALELAKKHETHVLTSSEINPTAFSKLNIHQHSGRWGLLSLVKTYKQIKNTHFDKIVIQYVPSLYAKRGGINFSVILFFLYLRITQSAQMNIIFHELYYPFSRYWKHFILHISHKLMLAGALMSAHISFFSTKRFLKESESFKLTCTKRFHLPVGDNMVLNEKEKTNSSSFELKNSFPHFIIIGSPHPSKNFNLVFKCLENNFLDGGKFLLNIVGPTYEDLSRSCELPVNFKSYTKVHPKLEDDKVIDLYRESDCNLAYFIDGLTTRRSSVIGSFAYGVEVLTTVTNYTEDVFKDKPFINLLNTDNINFSIQMKQFLKNYTVPDKSRRSEVVDYYQTNFSWESIVKKIEKTWDS